MIIKNKPEEKSKKPKSNCLYKRFGAGIHLLKRKDDGKFELMVISYICADALFINEDDDVTYIKSNSGKIQWTDFDKYYTYIKKLNKDELVLDLKK